MCVYTEVHVCVCVCFMYLYYIGISISIYVHISVFNGINHWKISNLPNTTAEHKTKFIYPSLIANNTLSMYIFLSASSCHMRYARKKLINLWDRFIHTKHVAHEKEEGVVAAHHPTRWTKNMGHLPNIGQCPNFFCSSKICLEPPLPFLHPKKCNPTYAYAHSYSIFDSWQFLPPFARYTFDPLINCLLTL